MKSLILGRKCVFKHHDLKRIDLKLNKYFHPLDVVGCGSETQFQVGANFNKLTSIKLAILVGFELLRTE